MQRVSQLPRIIGVGQTPLSQGASAETPLSLMVAALRAAMADAADGGTGASAGARAPHRPSPVPGQPAPLISLEDLDGLIAMPALMGEDRFMVAHAVAGAAGLLAPAAARARRGRGLVVRTLDVGGAG
jgi:hypothetical protein